MPQVTSFLRDYKSCHLTRGHECTDDACTSAHSSLINIGINECQYCFAKRTSIAAAQCPLQDIMGSSKAHIHSALSM